MGGEAGRPTPVSDLDVPFVSLAGAPGSYLAALKELGDGGQWLGRNELGYFVIGYDETQAILRDRRWHSGIAELNTSDDEDFERWRREREPSLLTLDGPDHRRLRQLIAPALTPRAVERLRPTAAEVIGELLDAAVARPGCEFVADVCAPYPVQLVFALLGAPPDTADAFLALTQEVSASRRDRTDDLHAIKHSTARLDAFAEQLLSEVAALGQPGLLADLLAAEERAELSRPELVALTETILVAGTESTSAQLACAATLLARFDDEYQRLRSEPGLAATATDEVMRYLGAVRGTARLASENIDHRGVRFPTGTLLMIGFAPANRDGRRFADPNRFDLARPPDPPHLTLGHGVHYCVGAALARLELQEALGALASRVEQIEVTGEIEWAPRTVDFWGPTQLPVTLHTG